jgi:hypothetical protein
VDPSIDLATGRTGTWTAVEESKLKDAVTTYGGKNWVAISALLPGRTKMQCYQRWHLSFLNVSEDSLAQLNFNDLVDAFLAGTVYGDLRRDNIVRDETGTITTSRCNINMDNVDLEDVNLQIDALHD